MMKTKPYGQSFGELSFGSFEFWSFEIVSNFGFRASDFGLASHARGLVLLIPWSKIEAQESTS